MRQHQCHSLSSSFGFLTRYSLDALLAVKFQMSSTSNQAMNAPYMQPQTLVLGLQIEIDLQGDKMHIV